MAALEDDPTDREDDPPGRSARRVVAIVGVVAAVVVVSLVGWRWRAERADVGTERPAELSWGDCLNGIYWTNPADGVTWWAGHDIDVAGRYESEPRRVRTRQFEGEQPVRSVVQTSVGTMHFDAVDTATFTSRTGGTMRFTRTSPGQVYTADCVGAPGAPPQPRDPSRVAWAEVNGVLGYPAPAGNGLGHLPDDVVLVRGEIRVAVDGMEVETVPIDDEGLFTLDVAVGEVTLTGTDDRGGSCGAATFTLVAGGHVTHDLLCPRR